MGPSATNPQRSAASDRTPNLVAAACLTFLFFLHLIPFLPAYLRLHILFSTPSFPAYSRDSVSPPPLPLPFQPSNQPPLLTSHDVFLGRVFSPFCTEPDTARLYIDFPSPPSPSVSRTSPCASFSAPPSISSAL